MCCSGSSALRRGDTPGESGARPALLPPPAPPAPPPGGGRTPGSTRGRARPSSHAELPQRREAPARDVLAPPLLEALLDLHRLDAVQREQPGAHVGLDQVLARAAERRVRDLHAD